MSKQKPKLVGTVSETPSGLKFQFPPIKELGKSKEKAPRVKVTFEKLTSRQAFRAIYEAMTGVPMDMEEYIEHRTRINNIAMFMSVLSDLFGEEQEWHSQWIAKKLYRHATPASVAKFTRHMELLRKSHEKTMKHCERYLKDLSYNWRILPPPLLGLHDSHLSKKKEDEIVRTEEYNKELAEKDGNRISSQKEKM